MRRWALATILLSLALAANAQVKFLSLRFNEDYSHLKHDTLKNWYHRMKYFPLHQSHKVYISQGGEVRYQFQHFTNEDWGEIPVESYQSFYTRFLYHADLRLSGHFRLFAQLNSTFAVGRVTPNRPIDQNVFDVQQVFFDVTPNQKITLRIGRQEWLYGSQRLIAVREGPNNRQSYDGIKWVWKNKHLQADAYYGHPVKVRQGLLDDRFNHREQLWSTYWVIHQVPVIKHLDLYYIGYRNEEKSYNAGSAEELRHSIGTRIWGKSERWNYDFEALYQFGAWGSQQINAYTASLDASYTFIHIKTKPSIGLKTEIISGDRSQTDNQLNTFNPLFPRGAYFGLAALIGPANLFDIHPSISFSPTEKMEVSLDYDVFWRYSLHDGIYGPNVALIFDSNSTERFIGHQVGLALDYQPNPFLKLTPEITWFYPGQYLKEVSSGKQVLFGAVTAQFKF